MIKKAFKEALSAFGFEIRKNNPSSNLNKRNNSKIGKGSNVDGVNLELRSSEKSRIYFEVGEDSLISGNFVFETASGKISIGNRTFIGGGLFVCIQEISIGSDVMFSWGCTVMDNNAHSVNWKERQEDVQNWKKGIDENAIGKYKNWTNVKSAAISIKDKVWVGFNVIILKGVTIGEGSIIGAGSVVTSNIPDWSIVAGNPAKIIRTISEDER